MFLLRIVVRNSVLLLVA